MQKCSYVAKFCKIPKTAQFGSCFLAISVGQPSHEGQKFIAALELVNECLKTCIVGVCDTLQRHTMATIANSSDSEIMHKPSKEAGNQWIERNESVCEQYLKIPYKIKRWDDWIGTKKYSCYRKEVDELYSKDKAFSKIIRDTGRTFNKKLKTKGYVFDEKIGEQNSTQYLLEECAVICSFYDERYDVEIYPFSRNQLVEYTLSRLKGEPLEFYKPLQFRCTKKLIVDDPSSKVALEKIIDVLPGHVYWLDIDGKVLGCNREMAKNLGFKNSNSLIGTHIKIPNLIQEKIKENDTKMIQSKQPCVFEEEAILQGRRKWFLSYKTPVVDKRDKVQGLVGVSLDITDKKDLEKKLLKQTKSLQKALVVRDNFLNTLSHELRTPIHVISSIAEEIHKNIYHFSREEFKDFFDVLVANNRRLTKLVHNLLEVAKSGQHSSSYVFEKKNIIDIIRSTIKEFSTLINILFETKFYSIITEVDEIKIAQILRNLLDNAVRYGEKSPIIVKLEVFKNNKNVIVNVQNKGEGICQIERTKIFEPFFQGSNKIINEGTGLGLTICHGILKAHGGSIWMEQNEGYTSVKFKVSYAECSEEKDLICG